MITNGSSGVYLVLMYVYLNNYQSEMYHKNDAIRPVAIQRQKMNVGIILLYCT